MYKRQEYGQDNAAKGVVLATGDSSYSDEYINEFAPGANRVFTRLCSDQGNVGDGHNMAAWAGGAFQEEMCIRDSRNLYLNVPMEELKGYVIDSLKDGEPVWFGSDVLQHCDQMCIRDRITLLHLNGIFTACQGTIISESFSIASLR